MSPELQFVFIIVLTFVTSTLTLLTGFGVGTILTPTFALLYDVKTAVLLVSIVHLSNNLLKFGLFRRSLNLVVLRRFGIVSMVGALAGSLLQSSLQSHLVSIILGCFLVATGIFEFLPQNPFKIPRALDQTGGFLSGFLGGIIGNQGAIRSAYLLNYDLSKESFIGTGTAIAILIDLTRIPVYLTYGTAMFETAGLRLLLVILIAFCGTFVGKGLLKHISLGRFRLVVASFLVLVGIRLFI